MPVREANDWAHGIITVGASLESETTAATLGKAGVRKFNPMSNIEFVSVPLGKYIQANLDFGKDLDDPPRIYGVNYFLKDENGEFLNAKTDKRIWLKWMELRGYGEVDAIETPIGKIPTYEDLARLFKDVQGVDYSKEVYNKQFMLRVPENIAKIDRITEIYQTKVNDTPEIVFDTLNEEKELLLAAQKEYGDYIEPDQFR
jgi:phosphoenolpyruvate carboxykinase (GTP)